jgi:precorrin-2/cobalt-factor-2 C20-methyltransferase
MAATLYVIGVGPGDPELLTLKGARALGKAGCICVPRGKEKGESLALSIVRQAIDLGGKEIVEAYFPMRRACGTAHREELEARWNETVLAVLERLGRGIDTAFITLGDPTLYSTFFYLYDRLLEASPGLAIEIIPGVSSINASASRARVPLGLGDGRIAILPAPSAADLRTALGAFDTVVIMKARKVFPTVVAVLAETDLSGKAVYVSRLGMADERVSRDLASVAVRDLDYFSLVIVRK